MKIIPLFILVLTAITTNAQELEFTGELKDLQPGTKVILTDLRPRSDLKGKRFHDTAVVSNDAFRFKTKLPGAGIYVLRIGLIGQNPEHRTLYLDAGIVRLTGKRGELKKAVVSGNDGYMKDYTRFTEIMESQEVFGRKKAIYDTAMALMASTGSYEGLFKDKAFLERETKVDQEARDKTLEIAWRWLEENPASDINAYVIYTYLARQDGDKRYKAAMEKLSPSARKSFPGKMLTDKF